MIDRKQGISELEEIIDLISESDFESAVEVTSDIVVPKKQLEPYLFWNTDHYTRNCVVRGKHYELLVLCWDVGQIAPIHCHDGQECWVKVIQGTFRERLYKYDEEDSNLHEIKSVEVSDNECTAIVDENIYHSLENTSNGKAISLHLYMNPIEKCTVYNADKKEFELKGLSYYSENGVLCDENLN